ncbi:hypothetical protein C8J56DRAFT_804889 [Mycena floridula]|nr:hypothetical protein C8J56DRAFT_804889 [Mycena floridula]
MLDHRGHGRGSYIFGRSVHNTRIECLWYDVTHGFGMKWKNFFLELELHHGLDPLRPADIWLLHHLFLKDINDDAQEWADSWNSHCMQFCRSRPQTPREMFLFSMVQDGPRGLDRLYVENPVDDVVEDPAAYGIDWEVADHPQLMNHLLEHNPQDWDEQNPFAHGPATQSHVECEPPTCPLTPAEVALLDLALVHRIHDLASRDMRIRRLVWSEAFTICNHLVHIRQ